MNERKQGQYPLPICIWVDNGHAFNTLEGKQCNETAGSFMKLSQTNGRENISLSDLRRLLLAFIQKYRRRNDLEG